MPTKKYRYTDYKKLWHIKKYCSKYIWGWCLRVMVITGALHTWQTDRIGQPTPQAHLEVRQISKRVADRRRDRQTVQGTDRHWETERESKKTDRGLVCWSNSVDCFSGRCSGVCSKLSIVRWLWWKLCSLHWSDLAQTGCRQLFLNLLLEKLYICQNLFHLALSVTSQKKLCPRQQR